MRGKAVVENNPANSDDRVDTLDLGTLWEIKSKADRVQVSRPDGSTVPVAVSNGVAGYVLDVAGDYSADVDGKTLTVKAS
jgi:hypothetical protein